MMSDSAKESTSYGEPDDGEFAGAAAHDGRSRAKSNLRRLGQLVKDKKVEGNADATFYKDVIHQLQENAENVQFGPEAALDAEVFSDLVKLALDDAQKRTSGQTSLDAEVITQALRRLATDEGTEIQTCVDLGNSQLRQWTLEAVPSAINKVMFMLGPISFIPEKKPTRRAGREQLDRSQVVKPLEGKDAALQREEVTAATVRHLHTVITRLTAPLCIFKFAVDPTSFSQTIENFFHIAFLVKQGLAAVTLDANGLPVIGLAQPDDGSVALTYRAQHILPLTMHLWKDLVSTFHIKRSFITDQMAVIDEERQRRQRDTEVR